MRRYRRQRPWMVLIWTVLLFPPTAELSLRILGVGRPIFTCADPELGTWHIPFSAGWYGEEGGSYVSMNSHGMRDVERSLAKPANTVRVAVLGDSFAEALQVSRDQTFCTWMEKELSRQPGMAGKKIEVLNFGCAGYVLAQEYLLLKKHVWAFDPDIVLLTLTTRNIFKNSRALAGAETRPFFLWEGDKFTLDTSFTEGSAYKRLNSNLTRCFTETTRYSHLLQVLNGIRSKIQFGNVNNKEKLQGADSEQDLTEKVYHEPRDAGWNEAWKTTEQGFLLLRDEVSDHGAQFLVVILSNGAQVHPEEKVRAEFARRLGVNDLFYPENRLVNYLNKQDVPVLALAPELLKHAQAKGTYLHGFRSMGSLGIGHWNEQGHEVAGRIMAHWLCTQCSNRDDHPAARHNVMLSDTH